MNLGGIEIFALIGFLIASYSVIANDSIQTLGTFLSSNAHRSWWSMWLYVGSIVIVVMIYGYFTIDVAFGRLQSLPYPETGIQWWHALPPLALLVLTHYGVPVSTTFLVLALFAITGGEATDGMVQKMLIKSSLGYAVALVAGGVVYMLVARVWEKWIYTTKGRRPGRCWVILQWSSTAFLWSQWLMQDLANIFVYLPRQGVNGDPTSPSPAIFVMATLVILALTAYMFARRGGKIQTIVRRKTNTTDIRAASLIDLIFGLILLVFKELSDIPMSTTWVFLGLLAGREIAISYAIRPDSWRDSLKDVGADVMRAGIGLTVSVALALGVPWMATGIPPVF